VLDAFYSDYMLAAMYKPSVNMQCWHIMTSITQRTIQTAYRDELTFCEVKYQFQHLIQLVSQTRF